MDVIILTVSNLKISLEGWEKWVQVYYSLRFQNNFDPMCVAVILSQIKRKVWTKKLYDT